MEAAVAQREEITPHLLRALEEVAAAPEKFRSRDYSLHLFAAYLLAQFREKRAYGLLTKILMSSGDTADELFGDTITEGLDKILASVYDGDAEPLKRLVEGEHVYEFVRGSAVDTFPILMNTGQMAREEVVNYYRDLFEGKLRREHNQVWNALVCAAADLPAPELLPQVRKAYEDDLVNPGYAQLEELELAARLLFDERPRWKKEKMSSLISDAIGEMEWWAAFHNDRAHDREWNQDVGEPDEDIFDYDPGITFRREGPKIGRNDPCPCGSGKKYKKCCLGKD